MTHKKIIKFNNQVKNNLRKMKKDQKLFKK